MMTPRISLTASSFSAVSLAMHHDLPLLSVVVRLHLGIDLMVTVLRQISLNSLNSVRCKSISIASPNKMGKLWSVLEEMLMSPSKTSSISNKTVDSARCGALFISERCVNVMLRVASVQTWLRNAPVCALERCPPRPEMRSLSEAGYGPDINLLRS